jgi:hypothetical protein
MPSVIKMSSAEVLALPVAVDLVTAGRALGLGRTLSYDLARAGKFPCPVLLLGERYRVTRADLLKTLGLDPEAHASPPPGSGQADAPRKGDNADPSEHEAKPRGAPPAAGHAAGCCLCGADRSGLRIIIYVGTPLREVRHDADSTDVGLDALKLG